MLGFSPDSQFLILVESMTEENFGIARAKMTIVQVANNVCISGGCISASGSKEDLKTEEEVLAEIYNKTWDLRKRLKLTQKELGGYRVKGPFFRGKPCGTTYYSYKNRQIFVDIQQKVTTGIYHPYKKAAMQLEIKMEGYHLPIILDSLENYREFIEKYYLGYLLVSPNQTGIAILVYAHHKGIDGEDIRTIVKTSSIFLPFKLGTS